MDLKVGDTPDALLYNLETALQAAALAKLLWKTITATLQRLPSLKIQSWSKLCYAVTMPS